MPMRAQRTEQIAESGVHRVMARFEDPGWGPIENKPHDLGTDIFVQVRERGFDLGSMVGVQVKTGPAYFKRHEGDPSAPEGWWYAESTKDHFDYWTSHALPHLLVLHDHTANTSYWVHVTADGVVDTGRGQGSSFLPRTRSMRTTVMSSWPSPARLVPTFLLKALFGLAGLRRLLPIS
jgi:hypothetical protein